MSEAKTFVKILKAKGLESYGVICKVGSTDKTEWAYLMNLRYRKDARGALQPCASGKAVK